MAVPRVEIADLMEATFWEANKLRIGAVIATVAVAVLVWQGWAGHRADRDASNWSALFDDTLTLKPEVDASSVDSTSAAAAWSLLAKARTAYTSKDFVGAEAALRGLRDSAAFEEINRSGAVSKLADDVAAELAFSATHTLTETKPVEGSPTIVWDAAGSRLEVRLFDSVASGPLKPFIDALREGNASSVSFTTSLTGNEISSSPLWGDIVPSLAEAPGVGVDRVTQLRTGRAPSNRVGTMAIRFKPGYTMESKEKELLPDLVVNLSDQPDRDSDSYVIGSIVSGLDVFQRAVDGGNDDENNLKSPVVLVRPSGK